MKRVITATAAALLLGACQGGPSVNEEEQSPRPILTAYIPAYKIDLSTPGDLSALRIPDRLYFFGIYPSAAGAWQVNPGIPEKLQVVRAAMSPDQEFFVVAGGGASATPNMHVMGTDAARREAYATALVNYAHQNGFDGIDIDWETDWSVIPALAVGKENLVDLLTRIRNKIDALPSDTKVRKLTTALPRHADSRELGAAVMDLVDQINVMVYDSYGTQAEGYPHAPMAMYREALENYVAAGVPKSKLLGGVPFYGGDKNADSVPTKPYRDIYEQASPALSGSVNTSGGFAFNGVDLLREKTRYTIDNDYAGVMIWEITHDVAYDNPLSLLRAMKSCFEQTPGPAKN